MTGARSLRRYECRWGDFSRKHHLVIPIFQANHKVKGFLGFSVEDFPVWYPGIPIIVERKRLVFKSAYDDRPPSWGEVDRELFADAYFFDPWDAVASVLPRISQAPPLKGGINLARATLQSRPMIDVYFEPALHRLRAIEVVDWLIFKRRIDVTTLPAFPEAIETSRNSSVIRVEGAQRASYPKSRREGFVTRFLRNALTEKRPTPPPDK